MCGRYTLAATPASLAETLPGFEIPDDFSPRYNIAPTQGVAVAPNNGENRIDFFRWGLIPSWAKDPKIGSRMINARSETLAEKPSFRTAYKRRRCLVLADGYYEWRRETDRGPKTPYYIRMASEKPFAFAGLWESWRQAGEDTSLLSCTIITCPPNEMLERIHHRMPVILDEENYAQWLNPTEQTPAELNHLLAPYPAEEMTAYAVSRRVNQPKNDSAECILPE
ncbi:MAG: SOS response-associated peptidase [Candidatus Poribacteria bacterium]|nr:SOS response-associated peptidase [Candidatus Poribacteria bacterium]MDE0504142.1 SOS response-associated peptidase [Candidatus Poribacteria bacterium]